jgi:GT2 family glycosyltransferase
MLSKNPLVSIVTINYNSTQVTCELLNSLRSSNYKNFEVIVVDNASKEDPVDMVRKNWPLAKVIVSDKNLGFSGGNNLGIREAKGDFIFFINNDTEITPDLIEQLLKPFFEDSSVGIVCPKIKFFYQPDTIQYAGFNKFNLLTGRTTAVGGHEKDSDAYNTSGYTNGAHGAAMMVARKAIEKVGMLSESYFLYYEEWDWSFKMINQGFNIYYQAQAVIYHKESVSTGKESILKTYYLSRNRILFMKHNTSTIRYWMFLLFLFFFVMPKNSVQYATRRRFDNLLYFIKGNIKGVFGSSGKETLPQF